MAKELTLLEGTVLDMVASGKTPRQIAEVLGVSPAEASKMAYDLLDREIITDAEQRRKLQVYRLEKIVDALWERTMKHADDADVKNLVMVLQQLNELLALNKEADAELMQKMYAHQLAVYKHTVNALTAAFRALAPNALATEAEWAEFTHSALEEAQKQLEA